MKQKYINILTKYKYTIVDDICEKATNSRLYNFDYREGWTSLASSSTNVQPEYSTSATSNPNKSSTILTEDISEESSSTKSPPDSEDAVSSLVCNTRNEINNILQAPPQASLNKDTIKAPTIEAMLHLLCPCKLKRTVDNDWAWDDTGVNQGKSGM